MNKYLGVDWGEKRIGLAIAEEDLNLALPYGTVADLAGVLQAIADEEVDYVVIGKPYKMTDTSHALSSDYLDFLKVLQDNVKVPVFEIDERLSSKAADAMGGSKKMRAGRDEIAAALILQNYLDRYGGNK